MVRRAAVGCKPCYRALTAHELIKVKIAEADRHARGTLCDAICARADAAEIQRVGKVLVLWRPKPDEGTSF
jgi:RNA-binding protein